MELEKIIKQEQKQKMSIDTYNLSASDIEVDDFINKAYSDFQSDINRQLMFEGIAYYNGDTDIQDKERFDYAGTKAKKNTNLSNVKINKNIMRKLTRQKVNTLLGKPYSIQTEEANYLKLLEDMYFTKNLYLKIFNLCKEAIKEGINWFNVYYDSQGKLNFRRVPGNQVQVFWKDRDHTEIDQLIHFYKVRVLIGSEHKDVEFADYYYSGGLIHYRKDDKSGWQRDTERPNVEGNFTVMQPKLNDITDEDGNVVATEFVRNEHGEIVYEPQVMVWDRIPWVALKYNSEEQSLLKYIKNKQDSYEQLFSMLVDTIKDIPNAIKVFRGYNGANLEEVMNNISQFRAVIVDPDGAVDNLDTPTNVDDIIKVLTQLRKDAYEDGGGVDVQNTETGDKSGVALKFLYSDLDLDLSELTREMDMFLENLLWFVDFDINLKYHVDYSEQEVTFKFNKTNIVNESELVDMINSSRSLLPDKLLLPIHPFVDDVSEALRLIEEQKKEQEEQFEQNMQKYGNTPVKQTNEEDE